MEKSRKISKSKLFFYACAILFFVFAIYYFSEIKSDVALFRQVNIWWLVVAVIAQIGTYLWSALIYKNILRKIHSEIPIGIWELFQGRLGTLFVNQTLPTGGFSGNIFFLHFLEHKKVAEADAISWILFETLTSYLVYIVIIAVALSTYVFRGEISGTFSFILVFGCVAYGVFSFFIGFLGKSKTIALIIRKISLIPFIGATINRSHEMDRYENIHSPWQLVAQQKGIFGETLFLQTCIFLSDSCTILALFWGLGFPLSLPIIILGYIMTRVVSMVPLLPGALILYEGSMTYFYVTLGSPVAATLIVTILYRVLSFWLPMLIGFLLYRKLKHVTNPF